jgi:hypothetical protein
MRVLPVIVDAQGAPSRFGFPLGNAAGKLRVLRMRRVSTRCAVHLAPMLPWRSGRTIVGADLQRLQERVRLLEREVARLMIRQEAAEAMRMEKEAAWIEASMEAKRIEAEVRAMAAWLEATTPHYPRV